MMSKDLFSFKSKLNASNPCSTPNHQKTLNGLELSHNLGHNLEPHLLQRWACSEPALTVGVMNNWRAQPALGVP